MLPQLVCLAYVRGFYFLSCCVEVSSVVLRCVVICRVVSVLLCCDPLCNCCVVSVELRCVVLRCDPLCCVALCRVVLLTSSAFLAFHLC